MSSMPEAGRQVGHVLLDAVSAWDGDAPPADNLRAINLALQRLHDLGVVNAFINERGEADVDVSDLVGPAVVLLLQAVSLAAPGNPDGEHGVIDALRQVLDRTL